LAGLLLFFPAIFLPIMGVGIAGLYNDASLFDCINILIEGDFYIIAFAVFMFTIAIPVLRLYSAFYLSYKLQNNEYPPSLLTFFRSYHMLDTWTMVHVFFLGIIVSMYKLVALADLSIGGGLISLVLLLLCSTLVSITLDQHYIWEKLEKPFASER
jgi:paraquat-inducible protein A